MTFFLVATLVVLSADAGLETTPEASVTSEPPEASTTSEPTESSVPSEPTQAPAATAAAIPKLVVMPLQSTSLPEGAVGTLNELLANSVRRLGKHEVSGLSDIDAMLGLENIKDQLGCSDVACAAQIGGALGAELLLAGQVARLGNSIVIVLKLIDAKHQQVVGSTTYKAANDENTYDQAVDNAVLQLFGMRKATKDAEAPKPGSDEFLKAFISKDDWQRYVDYRAKDGNTMSLSQWVNEQNKESNLLLAGEILSGAVLLLSAATTIPEPHIGDMPLYGGTALTSLIVLVAVDLFDIGSVPVSGG